MKDAAFVFKVPDELTDEMVTPVNCALSQVIHSLPKTGPEARRQRRHPGRGRSRHQRDGRRPDDGRGHDHRHRRRARAPQAGEAVRRGRGHRHRRGVTGPDRIGKVMGLTGGRGADIVVEFVGIPAAMPEGMNMVRAGGTYLEIGNISLVQDDGHRPVEPRLAQQEASSPTVMYDPIILPDRDRLPRSATRTASRWPTSSPTASRWTRSTKRSSKPSGGQADLRFAGGDHAVERTRPTNRRSGVIPPALPTPARRRPGRALSG